MLLHDAHPGYITWERFEENERQLRDNAQSYGAQRRGPPREGPALLQGLAICGVCGRNMGVTTRAKARSVHVRGSYETADTGSRRRHRPGGRRTAGGADDTAQLDLALQVQDELAARAEEADLWRAQRVQRAREEANLARQRFMQAHSYGCRSVPSPWVVPTRTQPDAL